jgi:hypothetical protein
MIVYIANLDLLLETECYYCSKSFKTIINIIISFAELSFGYFYVTIYWLHRKIFKLSFIFYTFSAYCDECNKSLKLHEEHDRLTYKNQYIFVRKTENNESHSDSTGEKPDETSESYQTVSHMKNFLKFIIKNCLTLKI